MADTEQMSEHRLLDSANASHTPGPWSRFSDYPFMIERVVGGLADGHDSYVVAEAKKHSLIGRDEAAANARLIAAAPELLLAAQNLRAAQRAYMADRGNSALGIVVGQCAEELDAAIAKANSQ